MCECVYTYANMFSFIRRKKEIHSPSHQTFKNAFVIGYLFMILWTFSETINMRWGQ